MAKEYKKRQEEIHKLVLDFEMKIKNDLDFYYDSESYEKIVKWYIDNPVSYTHLTLPTNREV